MRPRPLHVFLLLMTIAAATAGAATTQPVDNVIRRAGAAPPVSQPGADQSAAGGVDTLRVVLSLSAVLGLIVLIAWGSRRMLPGAARARGGQFIQVLSRTPVSAKQKILLIQVGRRVLVVGDSGQQLNTLCEIADADEAAALIGQLRSDRASSTAGGFADLLASATERFRKPGAEAAPPTQTDDLARTQQELDGLLHRVRGMARQADG